MSTGKRLEQSEYENIEKFTLRFSETEKREFRVIYWGMKKVRVTEIESNFFPFLYDDSTIFLVTNMKQGELMWLEKNSTDLKQLSRTNIVVEIKDKKFQCQFARIFPSVIPIGDYFGNVIFKTTPLKI